MLIDHSKIAVLSFYTPDFQPLADVTLPNKQRYCDKWGYKHIVKLTPYGNPADYYAFQRLRYIRDIFAGTVEEGKGIEVIFVLNGHAIVMNHNIQVESLLDEEHDFFIAKNCNGRQINAGVFVIRKSDWSIKWIDHILSYGDRHHDYPEKEQNIIIENENHPEFKDRIKILPMASLQSHYWDLYNWSTETDGHFQRGDFVLHIPGRSVHANPAHSLMESRIELFKSERVQKDIIY